MLAPFHVLLMDHDLSDKQSQQFRGQLLDVGVPFCQSKDDFANLWRVLMALLRSDWFPDCAVKCVWHDDDGTSEDVLDQAWKLKT